MRSGAALITSIELVEAPKAYLRLAPPPHRDGAGESLRRTVKEVCFVSPMRRSRVAASSSRLRFATLISIRTGPWAATKMSLNRKARGEPSGYVITVLNAPDLAASAYVKLDTKRAFVRLPGDPTVIRKVS